MCADIAASTEGLGRLYGQKAGHRVTQGLTPIPQVRSVISQDVLPGYENPDAFTLPNDTAPAHQKIHGKASVSVRGRPAMGPRGHVHATATVPDTAARLPHYRPIVGPVFEGTGAAQAKGRRPRWGGTAPLGMVATHATMGTVHVYRGRLDDRENADIVEHIPGYSSLKKRIPHLSTQLSAHIRVRLHVYPICILTTASY